MKIFPLCNLRNAQENIKLTSIYGTFIWRYFINPWDINMELFTIMLNGITWNIQTRQKFSSVRICIRLFLITNNESRKCLSLWTHCSQNIFLSILDISTGRNWWWRERKRRKMASDIYATEITDCNWAQTQILLCQCSFTLICNDIFYNNVLHATLFTIARTTPMSIKEWRWKGK